MKTTRRERVACALTTAVVLGGGSILSAVPASADTPGCVSRAEYRSVSKGMGKAKIAAVFDTTGSRMAYVVSGGNNAETRSYRTCLQYSSVIVLFSNGRLSTKAATWVYV